MSLGDRYERLGEQKDFETAINNAQVSLDLATSDCPHRGKALQALAVFSQKRFQWVGDLVDIEAAIQKYQEALDCIPADDPDRAQVLFKAATCFGNRYQRLGEPKDLETAAEEAKKALGLTPTNHPHRVEILRGVAWCFRARYQTLGTLEVLDTAIQMSQEILTKISSNDPVKAVDLFHLATCFRYRYQLSDNVQDLNTAGKNYNMALSLTPKNHPRRIQILQYLAVCIQLRYNRSGDLRDLEDAMKRNQDILKEMPENHPARAPVLFKLATCFGDWYRTFNDLKDLQIATRTALTALSLIPPNHPDRAPGLFGLAWCFQQRYQKLGDVTHLSIAIQKWEEGLNQTLVNVNPVEQMQVLFNLASSLGDRYQRLGDQSDLNAAIQKSQEALDLIPADQPLNIAMLERIALYFQKRYERLGDLIDLNTAIQKYQQTVDLTSANSRAYPLLGLAMTLRDRYRRLNDLDDLKTAIKTFHQALNVIPEYYPYRAEGLQGLASCFGDKYQRLGKSKDLKRAHKHYNASFKTVTIARPEIVWDAALEWVAFVKEYKLSYCLAAYSAAFHILPELLWVGHAISVRHEAVYRLNVGPVAAAATRICIQLSDLATGVQMIEQGVATIFQQILQLRPEVDTLPRELAQNLKKLSSELYTPTTYNRGDVAIERNVLLDKIRKRRGHQNFLLPKPYSILRDAAQGGPVVMLNGHKDGCDGIIILDPISEPVHVPLPDVTLDLLKSWQEMLKNLLGHCNVRARGESASTRLFGRPDNFTFKTEEAFADLLAWLWENIVDPVYQVLASHGIHNGRLWWLPTGSFTGLPFHASTPTDQFIHSYTATLGSLLDAQARGPSTTQYKVGVVGITHTGPGGRNYLKGVEQEVKNICSAAKHLSVQCLQGDHATPDAVTQQLKDCSWIHLACHATQDMVDPTKSHLLLYEGSLELGRILQLPLSNAEFVFLAACQTAMGDAALVNESFHLGGGLIAAGFRSAVGTLWSMNDEDGPLVAEIFYSHLVRNDQQPQVIDTAEALQLSVNELKARNVSYERWVSFIHMGI
ncbi:CHAT domain-containing protein [Mycena galopus ATCC 62051]|nr:CHAT domain-containing protein [Mycena galopus ATCC 62051]